MATIDKDAASRRLLLNSLAVTAECIDTADLSDLSMSGDSRGPPNAPPLVQMAVALIDAESFDRDDPSSISQAIGAAAGRGTAGAFPSRTHGTLHPPATVFLPHGTLDAPEDVAVLLAVALIFTPRDADETTSAPELVMTAVVSVTAMLQQQQAAAQKSSSSTTLPVSSTAAAVDDGVSYIVLTANVGDVDTTTTPISNVTLQLSRPTLRSTGTTPTARVALRLKCEPMTAGFHAGTRGCRQGAGQQAAACTYGCMPLDELYRHNCYGAARIRNHVNGNASALINLRDKKTVNAGVLAALRANNLSAPMATLVMGPGRVLTRWSMLQSLDLSGNIVGDANLPAVLSVVAHCVGLDSFVADRNSLSLNSAVPLFHVLSQHPSIRRVSLRDNDFFEAAGDELLRIVKVNRRIVQFDMRGNAISDVLQKRFIAQVERNVKELMEDVFNPFSPHYALPSDDQDASGSRYPTSPDQLAIATWDHVRVAWSLLVAAPKDENATSASAASTVEPIVPPTVNAPLFAAVATRTFKTLSRLITDPVLRQIIAPLCTVEEPAAEAQTVAADLARAALRTDLFVTRADGTTEYADQSLALGGGGGHAASHAEYSVAKAVLDADATAEYLYPNSFAKMHIVALGTMASFPHRWAYAARAVKCLGRAHEVLGVSDGFYTAYNKAFYDAMLHELGPDVMHHTMRAAWLQASAFILRTLASGRSNVFIADLARSL